MHPEAKILDDLVRRIIEVVQPQRIILFGSAARGDMRPDSDIDIPGGRPRRHAPTPDGTDHLPEPDRLACCG